MKASERISTPTETYTVKAGDTLSPIGQKYSIDWERIADANGLKEPFPLQINQVLVIPKLTAAKTTQVLLTTDPSRARDAQTKSDQGRDSWRTDPLATAKLEQAGLFGLSETADYRLSTPVTDQGTAVVTATRLIGSSTQTYEIALIQPVTKGTTGIWAIQSVTKKG